MPRCDHALCVVLLCGGVCCHRHVVVGIKKLANEKHDDVFDGFAYVWMYCTSYGSFSRVSHYLGGSFFGVWIAVGT
jgi:hypothetical protein